MKKIILQIQKQNFVLFLIMICSFSFAQTGWTLDPTFNNKIVKTDDFFYRIGQRSDGKFYFVQQNDIKKLKLMNANGTIDANYVGTAESNIQVIAASAGGKTYIGGNFTNFMNIFAPRIARLNADGTRDINFLPDTSTQSVYALQEQTDGKLLVGRDNSIQRLNSDGTIDTSFTAVTTNGVVMSIAILPNGKILAGGLFQTINGVSRNRVVLLNANGSVDSAFVLGTGFNNDVNIVRVASDGSFFIGGKFTTFKGTTVNRIAKISNTGILDTTFHSSNAGFDNEVWTIEFLNDNKPLIGGAFKKYKNIANNSILKLNLDGSVDSTFDSGVTSQSTGDVYKIIINSANDVLISGSFLKYQNTNTNQAVLLNNNGSLNSTFHLDERFCVPGFSLEFYAFSNSYGPIGGAFESDGPVVDYAYAQQPDGKIILGSVFYENKFYTLIRLNTDGTIDNTFSFNTSALPTNQTVWSIKDIIIRPNGKIICTGSAGRADLAYDGGVYLKGLFQLNTDGSIDSSFNTGYIYTGPTADSGGYYRTPTIALQNDGKLILFMNESFNYKGFQANAGAIRILENGNLDLSFQNVLGSFDSSKVEILILPNDKILLYHYNPTNSGYGANPNQNEEYAVVILNSDGTINNRFENFILDQTGSGRAYISKIKLIDDKLLICGKFNKLNNVNTFKAVYVDLNGNPITYFTNLGLPTVNQGAIFDVEKYNDKYYFMVNNDSYTGGQPNFNYTILRANINGTIDNTFTPVVLPASKNIFWNSYRDRSFQDGIYSPRNLLIKFTAPNLLTIYGTYNSILGNSSYMGLSRIILNGNLSVDQNQSSKSDITVYPNPVTDYIIFSEEIQYAKIYDMSGKLVKALGSNSRANIDNLQSGIYMVIITDKLGKTKSTKIIKK